MVNCYTLLESGDKLEPICNAPVTVKMFGAGRRGVVKPKVLRRLSRLQVVLGLVMLCDHGKGNWNGFGVRKGESIFTKK